jgi:hypothetical protein
MNTLKNHIIIYDDECPMCKAYTNTFVKSGMLEEHGREAFSQINNDLYKSINTKRACNEIALFNKNTGAVTYGVDSLMIVIGNSLSFLKPLFRTDAFKWLMRKAYFFISFNRKIILPSKKIKGACVPSFNLGYRLAYIFIIWIVTSFSLNIYSRQLIPIVPPSNFYREFLICGGQIIFQGFILLFLRRDKIMEYLGNMMTVSLAGSILLFPGLLLKSVIHSPLFYLTFFMIIVGLMFLEHIRRVKLIEVHWVTSLCWVFYRIIVLFIIGVL